jgi:hypothetical protein
MAFFDHVDVHINNGLASSSIVVLINLKKNILYVECFLIYLMTHFDHSKSKV